jgi:sodium/potassium/calcium exchanger 6
VLAHRPRIFATHHNKTPDTSKTLKIPPLEKKTKSAEPHKPPALHGGAAGAAGAAALALLGFAAGVAWIDTIASEVVSALTFLGALYSVPGGVLGLTALAWGNSLGDFFGNRAMARAGRGGTALTACFASPLFNMLMSLGLGFGAYFREHGAGVRRVEVALTPEVAIGCAFLATYCAAVAATGWACGQRLPRWFALFARAWYALYLGAALWAGLSSGGGGG